MKSKFKFSSATIIFLLIAIVVSACGSSSTPTAAPPAVEAPPLTEAPVSPPVEVQVPTQTPQVSGDPVWERVQTATKIMFGTSADYKPFEYYDENYQIVGFDAALARELASRLGLQVELIDIAFEGLPTALQIGQIDAAIAALSVTPNRQAIMDFTNVYYSGQDMVIARQGSGFERIVAPAQLGQYRVGVERGSVYETWIQTTLVDAGLIAATNLFAYEKPEHAVRDLRENRLDVVMMDRVPAEEYLLEGGLETVGQGLNTQLLAIALPKGATTLQAKLNEALIQLQNDGTIARLLDQYLQVDISQVKPVVPPTAVPLPTQAAPIPTAPPVGCYDGMDFVADLTIPDYTVINPGQNFDKAWRIRNTGSCVWNNSYRFVFVQGDKMKGEQQSVRGSVNPGNIYDMTVSLKAPNQPGKYTGIWQMVNGQGVPFGMRVWVKIKVPGAEPPPTSAPRPTAIPEQPILPPSSSIVIDYFKVTSKSVSQGDVITVSWSFSGEGLAAARLTRTNPDGTQTALYGGADVDYQGSYDDIMMDTGTYVYTLSVSSEFGNTVVKTVKVTVK